MLFNSSCTQAQKVIKPQSGLISYTGRVRMSAEGAQFSYPGTEIRFKTNSSKLVLFLADSFNAYPFERNQYSVYINGMLRRKIKITDSKDVYRISGLDTQTLNEVRIVKRTESKVGFGLFTGLMIDNEAEIQPFPYEDAKKIIFIGNSITCGYGVHASSENDNFTSATESVEESYAGIISQKLHAESHFIAYSGKGIYRNWGQKPPYINTMDQLYTRTLAEDHDSSWNAQNFIPDWVFISLGTNDFSPPSGADSASFVGKYTKLVESIHNQYGNIPVFMLQSSMLLSQSRIDLQTYLTDIEAYFKAKNMNVNFVDVSYQTGKLGYGANWHPSAKQARFNANEILDYLKTNGYIN